MSYIPIAKARGFTTHLDKLILENPEALMALVKILAHLTSSGSVPSGASSILVRFIIRSLSLSVYSVPSSMSRILYSEKNLG